MEACCLQQIIFSVFLSLLIGMPVPDIISEGVKQNLAGIRQKRLHVPLPTIRILGNGSQISGSEIDMSPGMGSKFIAILFHSLGNLLNGFPILFNIGVCPVLRV